jgi:hypothetical protein
MKITLRLAIYIAFFLVMALLVLLVCRGYDSALLHLANYKKGLGIQDMNKEPVYLYAFRFLIALLFFIELILVVSLVKFKKIYPEVLKIVSETKRSVIHRFHNDWSGPLLFLMVIPVAASIYLAVTMPISLDEVATYMCFSSRSVLASISYYPYPNNHILHSIMTNFFLLLPLPHIIAIRMPVILVTILCILFLFSFLKEYYNTYVAYISIAFSSTLFMPLYYSYLSRGYELISLFFILMTYSIYKISGDSHNRKFWFYLLVSSIGGLYTIPTFLYPFLMGNLFLVITFRKITKEQLVSGLIVSFVVFCLYLPIIVVNGVHSLLDNPYVAPISRLDVVKGIPSLFYYTIMNISGLPTIVIVAVICVGFYTILYRYKDKNRYYFPLIFIVSPILLILHSVLPPDRTFNYFNSIFSFYIGVVFYEFLRRYISDIYYIPGLLIIQMLMVYHGKSEIYKREQYAISVRKDWPLISAGKDFFICSHFFPTYLCFYTKEYNVKGTFIERHSIEELRVNMDTISKTRHDFYILDKYCDDTRIRKPISENEFYSIYK